MTKAAPRLLCLAAFVAILTASSESIGCCADAAMPESADDALAVAILKKADLHPGVMALPFIEPGRLAAALASHSDGLLYGVAPSVEAVAAARQSAAQQGVLGWQVVIETGEPGRLALADGEADLLVVANATAAELAALPAAEVRRVVAPYRGKVVINTPIMGLSTAALRAWASAVGGTMTTTEDASGRWLVMRMPALKGGDDWGHYYHAADGNPLSQDTAISAQPWMALQWTGGPYSAGKFDTEVAAGGRVFSAQSTIYWSHGQPSVLRARSLANGEVLWTRPLPGDFGDIGSLMVATPERLYCKDHADVAILDPETGREAGRYPGQDQALDVQWLLLSDDVLIVLSGKKRTEDQWMRGANNNRAHPEAQDIENAAFVATSLVAVDTLSGKPLWQFTAKQIDAAKVAISHGRLFLYVDLEYAAAMDLHSGKLLWRTHCPIPAPLNPGMGLGWELNSILTPRQTGMATDTVYMIDSQAHRQGQCFAANDGHIMWTLMQGKPSEDPAVTTRAAQALPAYPVIIGDTIFQNQQWNVSLSSGADIKSDTTMWYAGCGHFTATSGGLLLGQMGEIYNPATKTYLAPGYSKAACGVSQFAADGDVIKVPADCAGCGEWRGFIVLHPQQERPGAPRPRLEKGPAGAASALASDASDWPTYRGQPDRRASSAAAVPDKAAIRWRWRSPVDIRRRAPSAGNLYDVGPDLVPALPVAVGDRIWTGGVDGSVVCLDRASGKELWRFATAGRVSAAVTVSDGRVLAGSQDGWVYCIDAVSGKLAWRWRMAPTERMVTVGGRLCSAWPVVANVLVVDGTVYAVASMLDQIDGTMLCALRVADGSLQWEHVYEHPAGRSGLVPGSGQLAFAHGRLWWHAGEIGLMQVDRSTGALSFPFAGHDFAQSRGQDVGVMPDDIVVIGGRQLILPPNDLDQAANCCGFIPKIDSTAPALRLTALHSTENLPAWDDQGVLLFMGTSTKPAKLILATDFTSAMIKLDTSLPAMPGWPRRVDLATPSLGSDTLLMGAGLNWDNNLGNLYSVALSANAAIALTNRQHAADPKLWWITYTVSTIRAISRQNPHVLWECELPAAAAIGSVALTRQGDVLVPLLDGSVVCIGTPATAR